MAAAGRLGPEAIANPKPGTRGYLKWYWTRGPGLAKWAASPKPWTTLYGHLVKFMLPGMAKRVTSAWFEEVFGIWSGERKGKNPLGPG